MRLTPLFVFLHLLKCQTELIGQRGLRHVALEAKRANAPSDFDVAGIRPLLAASGKRCPPAAGS